MVRTVRLRLFQPEPFLAVPGQLTVVIWSALRVAFWDGTQPATGGVRAPVRTSMAMIHAYQFLSVLPIVRFHFRGMRLFNRYHNLLQHHISALCLATLIKVRF